MRKDVKIIMAVCILVLIGLICYALFLPGQKSSEATTQTSTDNTTADNTAGTDNSAAPATQPSDTSVAVAPATQPADETSVAVSPTTMPSEMAMNNAPTQTQSASPVAIAPTSGDWNKLLSTGASSPDTTTSGTGTSVNTSRFLSNQEISESATGSNSGSATSSVPMPQSGMSNSESTSGQISTSATGQRTYTIKSGDTPSSIALAMYGNRALYTKILAANPKLNARHMHVGQKITLPDISATATKTHPESTSTPDTSITPIETSTPTESATGSKYTVASGDSLQRIAIKLYGSSAQWEKIYTLNKSKIGSNPARLRVGMVLMLPQAPNASEPPAAPSKKHSAASVTPENTNATPSTTMQ